MGKRNYYDTIADIYDQTRWLTESVAEEVADFIVELVSILGNPPALLGDSHSLTVPGV